MIWIPKAILTMTVGAFTIVIIAFISYSLYLSWQSFKVKNNRVKLLQAILAWIGIIAACYAVGSFVNWAFDITPIL